MSSILLHTKLHTSAVFDSIWSYFTANQPKSKTTSNTLNYL